jgi:hypothetical protein
MLFDSFPDLQRARDFAVAVNSRFGLDAGAFANDAEAERFGLEWIVPSDIPHVYVVRAEGDEKLAADDWQTLIAVYDHDYEDNSYYTSAQLIARGMSKQSVRALALEHTIEKMVKDFGGAFHST